MRKAEIKNEFKNYNEIKSAVQSGKKVCWSNSLYDVEFWENQGWLMVVCNINDNSVGLQDNDYDISRCFTA